MQAPTGGIAEIYSRARIEGRLLSGDVTAGRFRDTAGESGASKRVDPRLFPAPGKKPEFPAFFLDKPGFVGDFRFRERSSRKSILQLRFCRPIPGGRPITLFGRRLRIANTGLPAHKQNSTLTR